MKYVINNIYHIINGMNLKNQICLYLETQIVWW